MRKVLLTVCVAALLQSVAFGNVVGTWAKTVVGSNDVWTLTVTPKAGETMQTFDGWVYTSAAEFAINPAPPSAPNASPDCYAGADAYTHFLIALGHGSGKTAVTDAMEVGASSGVDATDLYSVVGAALGGAYDHTATGGGLGWNSALALLQIAVPTTADPFSINYNLASGLNGLSAASSDQYFPAGKPDNAIVWIDANSTPRQIVFVTPEPGTLALLGCGLFGLLAYAWRKRK
jgi:hypothetical protein